MAATASGSAFHAAPEILQSAERRIPSMGDLYFVLNVMKG
jgi:hypothetical protein